MAKPDWITLSKNSGTGNDTVTVTASPNTFTSVRSGVVIVTADGLTQEVTVTQAGRWGIINADMNLGVIFITNEVWEDFIGEVERAIRIIPFIYVYNPETNGLVRIDSEVTDVIKKPVSGASGGTQIRFRVTNYGIDFAGVLFGVFVRVADADNEEKQYAGNVSLSADSAVIMHNGKSYIYDADANSEDGTLYLKDFSDPAAISLISGDNELDMNEGSLRVNIDTLYTFID